MKKTPESGSPEKDNPRLKKIIKEYSKIAFCNILDFYTEEDGVMTVKPLKDIPPRTAGAIASFKQTKDGWELKLHDKFKALEALAKIEGVMTGDNDDVQITVNHMVPREEDNSSSGEPACKKESE